MRYLIFYPPSKSMRLIDIGENIRVEDVVQLAQREFDLKDDNVNNPSEISIALNYNGSDLKPKWLFADLSIPSGAIIRCLSREKEAAELNIHCEFNKQILKLFDSSITNDTNIGTIRIKISEKLGLPLSTFCLETYDGKTRLYDEMKLFNYDIKIHDHIHLKVWQGYEKLINSCIRGFTEQYSCDDLTRHYQTQIALYIAAFYGHMELATSVVQQGARSDRPVGEHPCRQWSFEYAASILPETLKCPIHIAIERGHVKMVDLFVRQSVLCTQTRYPITGHLPYKLALTCAVAQKNKEEKQRFSEIYFYLHDKQYSLKVPLNANGEYVSSLLTATTTISAAHRSSTHYIFVSLPCYCRIIGWYERAREKVWKKYGGHFYITAPTRRIYPRKGLLGYKVLIDGYNHTFEVPAEQRNINSTGISRSDIANRYVGFSDEEREKIIQTKIFMKQFSLIERRRSKRTIAVNLQQSRQPPLLLSSQISTDINKHPTITTRALENFSLSSELSNSQILSALDFKAFKPTLDEENSSVASLLPSALINPIQVEKSHKSKEKTKRISKKLQQTPLIAVVNEDDKQALPTIHSPTPSSTLAEKLETHSNVNKHNFQPVMPSVDAYLLSSARLAYETEQRTAARRRELFTQVEQLMQSERQPVESTTDLVNRRSASVPTYRPPSVDVEAYIPLPDHPTTVDVGPIRSRIDLQIHQSSIQPYERHASASTRTTAIKCLQEAAYFKKKSWLQQVEISKQMVKNHVQRRIRRADQGTNKNSSLLPLRGNVTTIPCKSNTVNVK